MLILFLSSGSFVSGAMWNLSIHTRVLAGKNERRGPTGHLETNKMLLASFPDQPTRVAKEAKDALKWVQLLWSGTLCSLLQERPRFWGLSILRHTQFLKTSQNQKGFSVRFLGSPTKVKSRRSSKFFNYQYSVVWWWLPIHPQVPHIQIRKPPIQTTNWM